MANRPQGELDGLTPERLTGIASVLYGWAALKGVPQFAEAARVLEAVANAERWLKAQDRGISYDPKGGMGGRGFFTVDHVEKEWSNAYKTLAAALGSIHPEAGGTA